MSAMKFCCEWYAPFYIDHLPLSCIRLIIQLLDDGWTCSNNILYPKEDRDRRTLFFACHNCEHQVQLVNLYPCSTNKSNLIQSNLLAIPLISASLQEWCLGTSLG